MSALLWISEEKDQAINLGNPFELLGTFAEMGKLAGSRYSEFGELFGVPDATMEQEDVDPEWLTTVQDQAKKFRTEFENELSTAGKAVLDELIDPTPDDEE